METYESYAHESTLKYLERLREYTEVLWGEGIISDKPLASFGAFSCSMVAFKNGTSKMALAHFFNDGDDEVPKALDDLIENFGSYKIKAVVVSGDNLDRLEKALIKKDMEICGVYPRALFGRNKDFISRDMVLVPSKEELFIYSTAQEIRKRF